MKKTVLLIMSMVMIFSFTACSGKSMDNNSTNGGDSNNTINGETKGLNYLTGEYNVDVNNERNRPVAVMVNNIKQSLPQYGVSSADILYELPVEGGITRLMAVYTDYTKVPDVCSIRSCRYYYPLLALGMDAVYIHWGADGTIATDTLNSTGIEHLDGKYFSESLFYRDTEREKTYSSEHCGYLKGSELPSAFKNMNFRTTLKDSTAKTAFSFKKSVNSISGDTCNKIDLPFSNAYYSTFTFDSSTKTYKKEHSGNPHMDSKTNKQLAFTNVLAIKTTVSIRNANNGLVNVDLSSGSGYYASNGEVIEITWKKDGDFSPLVIMDKNGSELKLNPGKTYIGIISKDRTITVE